MFGAVQAGAEGSEDSGLQVEGILVSSFAEGGDGFYCQRGSMPLGPVAGAAFSAGPPGRQEGQAAYATGSISDGPAAPGAMKHCGVLGCGLARASGGSPPALWRFERRHSGEVRRIEPFADKRGRLSLRFLADGSCGALDGP